MGEINANNWCKPWPKICSIWSIKEYV